MWGLLSDPGHADSFDRHGEAYAPLRRLVEQLARREYADHVYVFKSLASFRLTTAPTFQQSPGHDEIGIQYVPDRGAFEIDYTEGPSVVASQVCDSRDVGDVIDCYARRLLSSRRPDDVEPSVVQKVVMLAMFVGMFAYLVFWSLTWARLPVQVPMLVSIGVAVAATGMYFFGVALIPGWGSGETNPPKGRGPGVGLGRLTALGIAIWFGAGGAVFLAVSVVGAPTKTAVWAFLATLAVAVVLIFVGHQLDRRWAAAARALRDAELGSAPARPRGDQGASTDSFPRSMTGIRST